MVQLILSYIVWILYAFFEGFRESFYWYLKAKLQLSKIMDLHSIFSLQRGLFLLIVFVSLFTELGFIGTTLYCISLALCFSFIHNGTYYITRDKLDKSYPIGWFSQSKTSTAFWTKFMTPISRTIQFIVGTGVITYLIYTYQK